MRIFEKMNVKQIPIINFDYPLPEEAIASHPLAQRDACRLIVAGSDGEISHRRFSDLPSLLSTDTLMVCNETRVINARMQFRKPTGSRIEIFLLEPVAPNDYALAFASEESCRWSCLVGNLKRWKSGSLTKSLHIEGIEGEVTLSASLMGELAGNAREIEFSWDNPDVSFARIVEAAGNIPIPPYLNRESQKCDEEDYQTVFSRVQGSVAAPTAGLHFTPTLLETLDKKGIQRIPLTLHVGAGTFQPVKSDNIGEHPMHTETFTVSRLLVENLLKAKQTGRTVLAVGTTSVRTLESLPMLGILLGMGDCSMHVSQWMAYSDEAIQTDTADALRILLGYMIKEEMESLTASTAIMIAPGFRWRITDRMITNFHQPQSTLLLLVSAFLEPRRTDFSTDDVPLWRRIYSEALSRDYRFLSYGDGCLFSRG